MATTPDLFGILRGSRATRTSIHTTVEDNDEKLDDDDAELSLSQEDVKKSFRGAMNALYSPMQLRVKNVVEHDRFDTVMGIIILSNVWLMVLQTNSKIDEAAGEREAPEWQAIAEILLQVVYTCECAMRIYLYRVPFFKNRWNLLDLTIVIFGFVDLGFTHFSDGANLADNVGIIRLFRIARLVRVLRILRLFPELFYMLRGFVGAMMAMWWGAVMIFALIMLWSIFAVEAVHGLNIQLDQQYCQEAFSSVQLCMLLFFQTLCAGDSWGNCAIPIIKQRPITAVIFVGAYIMVQLGFTNLVLAVIVERANQNGSSDAASEAKKKEKARKAAVLNIRRKLERIDVDKSGALSWEEVMGGYRSCKEIKDLFEVVDIQEEDLASMFKLMANDDGEVDYKLLSESLIRCEQKHLPMQAMMMDLKMKKILGSASDLGATQSKTMAHSKTVPILASKTMDNLSSKEVKQPSKVGNAESLDKSIAKLRDSLGKQMRDLQDTISKTITVQMETQVAASASNAALIEKLFDAVIGSIGGLQHKPAVNSLPPSLGQPTAAPASARNPVNVVTTSSDRDREREQRSMTKEEEEGSMDKTGSVRRGGKTKKHVEQKKTGDEKDDRPNKRAPSDPANDP